MSKEVKLADDEELNDLLRRSRDKVAAMSPEERKAMIEAQAHSYARSLQPCEHGTVDFEQCNDCRRQALEAQP